MLVSLTRLLRRRLVVPRQVRRLRAELANCRDQLKGHDEAKTSLVNLSQVWDLQLRIKAIKRELQDLLL